MEKRLLRKCLKGFENKLLLEVGCGTGHFTRWFHFLGIETVGVDISREMLSAAKAFSSGSFSLCQSQAESLPFKDEAFNLVVMITALEFIAKPHEALAEALRVGRDKVVLGMLNSWSPLILMRKIKRLFTKSSYRGANFYSSKKIKSLINRVARDKNFLLAINELRSRTLPPFFNSFFVVELKKALPDKV